MIEKQKKNRKKVIFGIFQTEYGWKWHEMKFWIGYEYQNCHRIKYSKIQIKFVLQLFATSSINLIPKKLKNQ